MEKIRIIDLLNKLSKGEEMPKLVKYHNYIYAYDEELCNYEFEESYLFDYTTGLNNEVEVIEDNKIRKLDFIEENSFSKKQNGMTNEDRRLLDSNFKEIGNKINEIIDKLEELE